MTRRMQNRDVNDPIAAIIRRHLGQLDVAAIHHGPIIRELQEHAADVVRRALTEATEDRPFATEYRVSFLPDDSALANRFSLWVQHEAGQVWTVAYRRVSESPYVRELLDRDGQWQTGSARHEHCRHDLDTALRLAREHAATAAAAWGYTAEQVAEMDTQLRQRGGDPMRLGGLVRRLWPEVYSPKMTDPEGRQP